MITVKFFGTFRLKSGLKEIQCEAKTVRSLYPEIIRQARLAKPESNISEKDLKKCFISVNDKRATLRTKLSDGDTVYFFPAVAGG